MTNDLNGLVDVPEVDISRLAAAADHHQAVPTATVKSIGYSRDLTVVYRKTDSLTPYAQNARTHSKSQIRKIRDSVQAFGFTNPVLINASGTIVAGHGRVEAAKLLRMTVVPTICLEDLSPDQIRAYILADNRLAEDAGWDHEVLKVELQHLIALPDFNLCLTGFEVAEIDLVIGSVAVEDPGDRVPPLAVTAVTESGDVWCLGKHRVVCGDSRHDFTYERLMLNRRADIVFTDPPYNVVIDGHATGNGRVHHSEFAMASGEMSQTEFTEFLTVTLKHLACWSRDGSVHFVAMDWRHMAEVLDAGHKAYDSLLNVCVWNKGQGGMGSLYRSQHEMFFAFKKGTAAHRNNIQLGKFGRNRTNVWNYPGANSLSRSGNEGNILAMHPTMKPIALVADALLDCSARRDVVLDAFLGAGTTLLAAERVGRICYGLEIEPRYVDLAIRRWQQLTGERARLEKTGLQFDDKEREASRG